MYMHVLVTDSQALPCNSTPESVCVYVCLRVRERELERENDSK